MEIVYYYDNNLKFSPVKEYFKNLLKNPKNSNCVLKRKLKILANIDAKINVIKENQARPVPPISKPLRNYSFIEILNPKDAKTLIRIFYFRYENKMVLLHAYEKPAHYKTNKEKKYIDNQNKIAQNYLINFKLNPNIYMKSINDKKQNIDSIKKARELPAFKEFYKEAEERIRLGQEIYKRRIDLGISQQELANMTNTTQKMISNIESANVDIRFSTLSKLKKALNFQADNWSRIYRFSFTKLEKNKGY